MVFWKQWKQRCWSSAGTDSMRLAWKWDADTPGTSSSLWSTQTYKTRWKYEIQFNLIINFQRDGEWMDEWNTCLIFNFLSSSCSYTIFLVTWWITSLHPAVNVKEAVASKHIPYIQLSTGIHAKSVLCVLPCRKSDLAYLQRKRGLSRCRVGEILQLH